MKPSVFEPQTDIYIRNLQIIHLAYIEKWANKKIADFVGLATSTIRNYKNKFFDLLSQAKEYFSTTTKKIKKFIKQTTADFEIQWNCPYEKGCCAYVIEYYNKNNDFVFLKVGKTKDIYKRIKQQFVAYQKAGWETVSAIVHKLFFAEDEDDALTIENCLRKHYKKQPQAGGFIPNDRFELCQFDENELSQDVDIMNKIQLFTI